LTSVYFPSSLALLFLVTRTSSHVLCPFFIISHPHLYSLVLVHQLSPSSLVLCPCPSSLTLVSCPLSLVHHLSPLPYQLPIISPLSLNVCLGLSIISFRPKIIVFNHFSAFVLVSCQCLSPLPLVPCLLSITPLTICPLSLVHHLSH